MRKLIDIHKKNDMYIVKFIGKPSEFNDYITKIMSVKKKKLDPESKRWAFEENEIRIIRELFGMNDSSPKPKVAEQIQNSIISKSSTVVTGYEDIGKNMKLQPYDYQKETIKFAKEAKEALLVLPCGSGKTPIGIGIYLEAKENGIIHGPGMVVVKASLKSQWLREVSKFSDLSATIVHSPSDAATNINSKIKRRQKKLKKAEQEKDTVAMRDITKEIISLKRQAGDAFKEQFKHGYDLYILNYETLNDAKVRTELRKAKVDFIMADEIHYVKNRKSKRSKSLCEFADVPFKIGATATPVSKSPEDLFGIFSFIAPSLFPKWSSFSKSYIKYGGFGKVVGALNLSKLAKEIKPNMFVKSKEDVAKQLPKLVTIQLHCELEPKQQEMYAQIQEALDDLKEQEFKIRSKAKSEDEVNRNEDLKKIEALILAHQTFAQQLADTEELLQMSESEMAKKFITGSKSQKMELLVEKVDEILSSGEKVAIYSRYKKMQDVIIKRFAKEFPEAKIAQVNGTLSGEQRYVEAYDKFRDTDEYKILLSSDAGAEGLNLSHCRYLIEIDRAESYAIQTQRFGRLERADSIHDTVFVYQLVCDESWDEIAQKIVDKKEGYDTELIRS